MEGTAHRIRELRERSGKAESDLADATGIPLQAYLDIETYDEKIAIAITINEARCLAERLSSDLLEIIAPHKAKKIKERISLSRLAQTIGEHIKEQNLTLRQFEDNCGWNLSQFLDNPDVGGSFPIMFLKDIARELKINWLALLPERS